MAEICNTLRGGQDLSCLIPEYVPFQEAKLINKSDIEDYTITVDCETDEYNVDFTLKEGASAFGFISSLNGNHIRGIDSLVRNGKDYAMWSHQLQFLFAGYDEASLCQREALAKGQIVGAIKYNDGTVKIYGLENGMRTQDYDYDLVEEEGLFPMVLTSSEGRPERYLPLVFSPATGDAEAIFDNDFKELEDE